jgi:hypothetical protein
MTFLASGRAWEAATATWNLSSWDCILNNLYFDWSQSKSGKQKGISLLSDFESYDIDFYHSLGSYFICEFGQRDHCKSEFENHWILPEISILERSGSSKKISLFLQDLSAESKNVDRIRCVCYLLDCSEQSALSHMPNSVIRSDWRPTCQVSNLGGV